MFKPKFELILKADNFSPDTTVCLGSQMVLIVKLLKDHLPMHIWYGADVDAFTNVLNEYNLNSRILKKIGTDQSFIDLCIRIDQFLSGVFFCYCQ